MLSRYGNPARGASGAVPPDVAAFATHFQDKFAARALRTNLDVLLLRSQGHCCPDRVMTLALNYVDDSFKYKELYKVLESEATCDIIS